MDQIQTIVWLKQEFSELIEAEDKYSTVYTKEKKFVLRISLNELLANLSANFIRTHRSIIVDATKIDRLNLETHELLVGNKTLPIGATYKELLISRLRKIG